jgi:hypothetical protein
MTFRTLWSAFSREIRSQEAKISTVSKLNFQWLEHIALGLQIPATCNIPEGELHPITITIEEEEEEESIGPEMVPCNDLGYDSIPVKQATSYAYRLSLEMAHEDLSRYELMNSEPSITPLVTIEVDGGLSWQEDIPGVIPEMGNNIDSQSDLHTIPAIPLNCLMEDPVEILAHPRNKVASIRFLDVDDLQDDLPICMDHENQSQNGRRFNATELFASAVAFKSQWKAAVAERKLRTNPH